MYRLFYIWWQNKRHVYPLSWELFLKFHGPPFASLLFTRFFFFLVQSVIFPARVNGATYYVLNDGGGKNKQAQKRNPLRSRQKKKKPKTKCVFGFSLFKYLEWLRRRRNASPARWRRRAERDDSAGHRRSSNPGQSKACLACGKRKSCRQ